MPEINAYVNYFPSKNIDCVVTTAAELNGIKRDVEWFFSGTDHSKLQDKIVCIHEYTSASTPPAAAWKNSINSFYSTCPHAGSF